MLEKLNRCYVSHSASTVFKRKKKKKEKKKLKTVLMKRIFGGGFVLFLVKDGMINR